ncbi:MAG: glycosyltransferase [Methanomassiliicoccaceae archaeon]|nr:glycosyltransferase [Methanomassiliicoccaceae archaeon]
MRIAMVTDSYHPTRDGVVTSIDIAKEGLEKLGHEVVVIAPDPGEEQRKEGVRYFPAVEFKSYPGYYVPIYPSNKSEILRSVDPDVIHIHGVAMMALKGLIAARNLKVPAVMTFHTMVEDTLQFYSPLKKMMEVQKRLIWVYLRGLLKRPDALIAPSEHAIDTLLAKGVRPKSSAVIPTGVDTEKLRPDLDGTVVRERYDLCDDKVVLYVGRLSYEKNIETVIDALRSVENVKLLIVGKGPAKDHLERTAEAAGVSERVIFTGFVSDDELPLHYAAADLFMTASRFETQGLTVLEALSCGLPVACIDEEVFTDLIKDNVNGFIFDGGAEGCAEAIRRGVSCDDTIKRNARATAGSMSVDLCAKKLAELYEDVIRKRKERK